MANLNIDLHIVFDNAGGIYLMADSYSHYYDNPKQAAADYVAILDGNHHIADGWDGNEPDAEMDYDYEVERNGGYRWFTADEIDLAAMQACGWHNVEAFAAAVIHLR